MPFEIKPNSSNLNLVIREPFCIFECDNVLGNSEYNQLYTEFPDKNYFIHTYTDKGGKSYLNNYSPEFFDFIASSPAWRAFYQSFFQPASVNTFYELANSFPSERPIFERLPWRLAAGPENQRKKLTMASVRKLLGRICGYTPVTVSFEFSYLESGCSIPPHTDVGRKLISLMIYFPDRGINYPLGAGTEFYRGKGNAMALRGWNAGMRSAPKNFYEEHEIFHTSVFSPNKLVGFIKSSYSWHGLKSLNLPPGVSRRSVNINYYLL